MKQQLGKISLCQLNLLRYALWSEQEIQSLIVDRQRRLKDKKMAILQAPDYSLCIIYIFSVYEIK